MLLALALSLTAPAHADESVAPVTVTVVGDGDAAGKKKRAAPAQAPAKAAPPASAPAQGNGAAQRPATAPAPRSAGARPTNLRSSPTTASAPARRTEGHESADHGADRHESASHESASHESARHESAEGSADRHRAADHRSGEHREAYAAERHRAASHHYASHHAAWVAHHTPYRWYGPWRAGHPHYWYHGVFVYGPPVVYVGGGGGESHGSGGHAAEPKRSVNREGKFSLGVTGGSYLSGFHDGSGYGDAGLGLKAAYRPVEALALEVSWQHHDATWSSDSARAQEPVQVSAELFAFPWAPVSPYVLAGVTMTDRNIDQPLGSGDTLQTDQSLWGPHGGVGIEFALGKSVALDFDARFIGYVNKPVGDPSSAGAIEANMGLNVYF